MKKKGNVQGRDLKKVMPLIVGTLKKYEIKKAGIFGSFVREEQGKGSDIDILIEPTKGLGLFNFIGIKLELEEKLRRKVDLLTYKSIHPMLKRNIKKEEVKII